MGYASRSGRAYANSQSPMAYGVCDRCGIWYFRKNLRNQYDWRGASLLPLNIYVCNDCYDVPNPQQRAIVVPADPVPIVQPRVEAFFQDETNFQTISGGGTTDPVTGIPIPGTTTLDTEDGQQLTTQVIGEPVGLEQGAVMPLYGQTHYGVALPILSVGANGTDQITVTCSSAHGLAPNGQISVEGLSDVRANGFYSVTVTTATAFTYQTAEVVPAGQLLTSTTNMITALVGLPLGSTQIPQV